MLFGAERAPATKLAHVRYDRVVEAFGGVGYHVEDPAQLVPVLREALDRPEVVCVNVPLDAGFRGGVRGGKVDGVAGRTRALIGGPV